MWTQRRMSRTSQQQVAPRRYQSRRKRNRVVPSQWLCSVRKPYRHQALPFYEISPTPTWVKRHCKHHMLQVRLSSFVLILCFIVNPNCFAAGWINQTANFYSRPRDMHSCTHDGRLALPFCTTSCHSMSSRRRQGSWLYICFLLPG